MINAILAICTILLACVSADPQGGPPRGGGTTSPAYTWLFQFPLPIAPVAQPLQQVTVNGRTIQYYELNIQSFSKKIYPNLGNANFVGYNGIAPGPTFRVQKGVESVVRLRNSGTGASTMHLHGSPSHSTWDGWASDLIQPGQYKDYYYPNFQSGPLWYHDHTTQLAAPNCYYGQVGTYIINDPAEDALGLPSGDYDVPLAIMDQTYKSNGDLLNPTASPVNFFGDIIHVNGQPWPYMKVEPRKYRFRFYDMSLSRAYALAFQDSSSRAISVKVVASDAGLFENTVTTSSPITIAMGERYEVVVDFAPYQGTNVSLANTYSDFFTPTFTNTGKIMRFVVGTTVSNTTNNGAVPSSLKTVNWPPARNSVDRTFNFQRGGDAFWTINGEAFSDVNNRILAQMPQGAVERWQLNYNGGPGVHPVHIHLVNMQIISRTGGSGRGVQPYESAGLKDIVLLEAGESVQVKAVYGPYNGLYMFHCHNLIHEDNMMMAVFNVSKLAALGYQYNSTQGFDNPQDPTYAAVNYQQSDYTAFAIRRKLRALAKLNAYGPAADLIQAEASYYTTAGYPQPTGK